MSPRTSAHLKRLNCAAERRNQIAYLLAERNRCLELARVFRFDGFRVGVVSALEGAHANHESAIKLMQAVAS